MQGHEISDVGLNQGLCAPEMPGLKPDARGLLLQLPYRSHEVLAAQAGDRQQPVAVLPEVRLSNI